jgi:hypothetical protein
MAVNVQRFFPLREARERRREISYYFKLDGSRYLLGAIVILCLMSMIALGQTGVVATKGYAIVELEQRQTELTRQHSQLQLQLAAAQSLETIRARAEQLGLRPINTDQVRYITVEELEPGATSTDPPVDKDGQPLTDD